MARLRRRRLELARVNNVVPHTLFRGFPRDAKRDLETQCGKHNFPLFYFPAKYFF